MTARTALAPVKTKAKFGRLLRPPAWKRNGPILKEVDKQGHK